MNEAHPAVIIGGEDQGAIECRFEIEHRCRRDEPGDVAFGVLVMVSSGLLCCSPTYAALMVEESWSV